MGFNSAFRGMKISGSLERLQTVSDMREWLRARSNGTDRGKSDVL